MRIPVDTDYAMRTVQRHWEHQQQVIASSSARIATGSRLVGAVDDAAGVAIAERVRSQFEAMRQLSRNAQDGINFVQIAEGTLTGSTDLVQRMRVMALQSANGTYTDDQRSHLQRSVVLTLDELDALAHRSSANGVGLLDGSRSALSITTSPDGRGPLQVALPTADSDGIGLAGLSIATQEDATSALDVLDEALEVLYEHRAEMAAARSRMERMIDTLGAAQEQATASHARINDADLGQETVRMLRAQIASDAGAAMMVQVRQATQLVLNLLLPQAPSLEQPSSQAAGADASTAPAGGSGAVAAPVSMPVTGPVSMPVSMPVTGPATGPIPVVVAQAAVLTSAGSAAFGSSGPGAGGRWG